MQKTVGVGTGVGAEAKAAAQAAVAEATGRVAAGAPVIDMKQPVAATLTLGADAPVRGSGRRFTKNWFLQRTDDLAVVTEEASNEVLGILNIQIQAPTDKMKASGIICKVAMETLTGWDYGITVWESKQNAGDIMLMVGGAREITNAKQSEQAQEVQPSSKQKRDFIRDRKLNDATTAQILCYVWKFLKPATA